MQTITVPLLPIYNSDNTLVIMTQSPINSQNTLPEENSFKSKLDPPLQMASRTPPRTRRTMFLVYLFTLIFALIHIPESGAFKHTSYSRCNSKFQDRLRSKCNLSTHYCGYRIVTLPRGGYEVSHASSTLVRTPSQVRDR